MREAGMHELESECDTTNDGIKRASIHMPSACIVDYYVLYNLFASHYQNNYIAFINKTNNKN